MVNQYLPLGCFGKLPCYGDFLEGSVFQPSSHALKKWIFGGREAAGLDGEEAERARPKETLRRRFLFGLPGSVELVAGVIRPSADSGRRRDFPFMVFTHFPRRLFGKHYSLLPMALSPVWEALDDAWDSLADVATRAAFKEVVDATRVPFPAPKAEVRGPYGSMLQESAGRMVDQNGLLLEELLKNLPEVTGRLKKGAGADGLILELPVSGNSAAACFDAAFWIDLLNHQFLWRRFEPAIFLEEPAAKKNNRVLLIFGILNAIDYAFIMGCEGAPARVIWPLGSMAASDQPAAPSDTDMSYAELLAKRMGSGG